MILKFYNKVSVNPISTTSILGLTRQQEKHLNRARVDCVFTAQLHGHNWNTLDSPNCLCGKPETAKHFFFKCPLRQQFYQPFYDKVQNLIDINIVPFRTENDKMSFFLHGHKSLSTAEHDQLFSIVSDFLIDQIYFKP